MKIQEADLFAKLLQTSLSPNTFTVSTFVLVMLVLLFH